MDTIDALSADAERNDEQAQFENSFYNIIDGVRCAILSGDPVIVLSIAITRKPSASKRSARCEPRNPAPPVITAVLVDNFE